MLINEMKYYNLVSSLLIQDCNLSTDVKLTKKNTVKRSWISSHDRWIKINMDTLRRHNTGQPLLYAL